MLGSSDSDIEIELPQCINNVIGTALRELGVLGTTGHVNHRQVLRELHRRPSTIRFNSGYVSNVSVGFRVRPLTPQVRYKPYMPIERHRTRSENNDDDEPLKEVADNALTVQQDAELIQLKKAKSLESIVAENSGIDLYNINIGSTSSGSGSSSSSAMQEVEVVSNSIQNLKVVE